MSPKPDTTGWVCLKLRKIETYILRHQLENSCTVQPCSGNVEKSPSTMFSVFSLSFIRRVSFWASCLHSALLSATLSASKVSISKIGPQTSCLRGLPGVFFEVGTPQRWRRRAPRIQAVHHQRRQQCRLPQNFPWMAHSSIHRYLRRATCAHDADQVRLTPQRQKGSSRMNSTPQTPSSIPILSSSMHMVWMTYLFRHTCTQRGSGSISLITFIYTPLH